jgi:hypothetical protein
MAAAPAMAAANSARLDGSGTADTFRDKRTLEAPPLKPVIERV